jgi:hypothetical protein
MIIAPLRYEAFPILVNPLEIAHGEMGPDHQPSSSIGALEQVNVTQSATDGPPLDYISDVDQYYSSEYPLENSFQDDFKSSAGSVLPENLVVIDSSVIDLLFGGVNNQSSLLVSRAYEQKMMGDEIPLVTTTA